MRRPAGDPTRWRGSLARGSTFVLCLLALPTVGWSGCLPLSTRDARQIDEFTEQSPEIALREAQDRLHDTTRPPDGLYAAQLYAVMADARAEQSHIDQANEAAAQGLKRLDGVAASPEEQRIRLRLNLLRSQMSIALSQSAAAIASVNRSMIGVASNTLEYACALSVRAMAYDYLNQNDRAVADALVAYRLADRNGWVNARLETAYTLARSFRRAGLFEQAQAMIDVVVEIGTSRKLTAMLSSAEYERGQLLISLHRFQEARAALEESRRYSASVGDRFGVAAANVPLCWTLINEGDLDRAESVCGSGQADLAASRADLAALMSSYNARLALDRSHPQRALNMLNTLLSSDVHAMIPAQEARIFRDRARAYRMLRQDSLAYADMQRAYELDVAADVDQRNRQVAALSAILASEALAADNRRLEEKVNHQLDDLLRQREVRALWAILAVAAALLAILSMYFYLAGRRYHEALRRHGIILRSAGSRSPDAFLVLDEKRRVCFANRNICGHDSVPAIGEPFGTHLPPGLAPVLDTAIDEALASRSLVNLSMEILDPQGLPRQWEMSVLPAVDAREALGATIRSIDVTEIRAFEREVIDVASLERQRLSSELHEGLGQQLAGVLLLVGSASKLARTGRPGIGPLIDEIAEYLGQSVAAVRELARGLAPVKIGCGSLSVALQSLVIDARNRLRIAVDCHCGLNDADLSDLAADHLYRICRESITNAAVHGHCRTVKLELELNSGYLDLTIADDGTGIAAIAAAENGFGIKMMAYRARLLGGTLRLAGNPGGGACVTVTVPMSHLGTPSQPPLRDDDPQLANAIRVSP